VDVIPSTLDLSGAEIELSSEPGREYIKEELIEDIRSLRLYNY
jgi:chromosome partitioning protein